MDEKEMFEKLITTLVDVIPEEDLSENNKFGKSMVKLSLVMGKLDDLMQNLGKIESKKASKLSKEINKFIDIIEDIL